MAETKDDIAAERDQLRAENENLRGQLAAAGVRRGVQRQEFILSEGEAAELRAQGVANIGGRRMTTAQVRERLGADQEATVDLGDVPAVDEAAWAQRQDRGAGIEGVDYIYPSVRPGAIDPAVAGTPGINGPSADDVLTDDEV